MSGRALVILLVAVTAIFGGALWYFQTRAYYREVVLLPPAPPQTATGQPAGPSGDAAPVVGTGSDGEARTEVPAPVQPGRLALAPDADTTAAPEPDRATPVHGVRLRMVRFSDDLPEDILVRDFRGIDADTSPIKFRACFSVENSIAYLTETYVIADEAEPIRAPGWFDCFDVEALTDDIASGAAVAFLGERDIRYGVDRVIAVYGDGRAFAWNQFNRCGLAVYSGNEAPDGCPPAPTGGQ